MESALGANYTLLERQGRGATGEVWSARDRRSGETVAAKLLHPELSADPELVGRFVRERSILVGLRDPHVVAVRDLVVEGDRLAIVMDLVDGGTLRDVLLAEGPLTPAEAVAAATAVAGGLAAAHARQVIHRDVKPDNVLLTSEWRSFREGALRLTDFGISRIVEGSTPATRGLLGTPEYIAPEVLTRGEADLPTDVYGLGVLLYELLAGRTPFAGEGTDYTVAHRHVAHDVPPLDVPAPLWDVLLMLLDKDPGRRPTAVRSAGALEALRPDLVGLPALSRQADPAGFAPVERPATVVRARHGDDAEASGHETGPTDLPDAGDAELPDLGPAGQTTIVRPVRTPRPTPAAATDDPAPSRKATAGRPPWRDPRLLGLLVAFLVLIGVAVLLVGGGDEEAPVAAGGVVDASQEDEVRPSGLTVRRSATYDAEAGVVTMSISYAAQSGSLAGPFLEILPGTDQTCPSVTWPGGEQQSNLPSSTGVTTPCGWAVDPGPVDPQGRVEVEAQVELTLTDPTAEGLQAWLDDAAGRTSAAVLDRETSSSDYAAQRLEGIEVVAPSSVPVQSPVEVTLLAVWPSGRDELSPLLRSPSGGGDPSSVLVAVAGGEEGVRFSDGCSGALAVSSDGLGVTARSIASGCTVDARVGNFADLVSNEFPVVARGG